MTLKKLLFFSSFLVITLSSLAQSNATVKVYKKIITTYPFSDPNPIPLFTKYYPYYRFDGYTDKPSKKEWTVVELENEFIKVTILPEVGGKIWSAYDKITKQDFLYNNDVVKFRDVAMRGPWTSGGIESNYGIFGHTPNCATPVDYTTLKKEDGSVSCVIGVLDLITRTPWTIDINLPKDKAYFTTQSLWFNATPIEEPYYHWMNVGLRSKGNLEFTYPGQNFIGHDGEVGEWPYNSKKDRKINYYEQNDFTGYHSYHVFGTYTNFFGAYYHDNENGMVRFAPHDEKAGKKIWIWGLARAGMIWEKLLTDKAGQYVEVQSGRLFNQSAENSTFSPFKHKSFAPYNTDLWKEYWYPVAATKGIKEANNIGAFNTVISQGKTHIYFNPVQAINDSLKIVQDNEVIATRFVQLKPMQLYHDSIANTNENLGFILGNNLLKYNIGEKNELERPTTTPVDFNWNTAYGLYIQGKEYIDQRMYPKAKEKLEASLQLDPYFLPALVKYASLQYYYFDYAAALKTIKTALSIDTHDGAANYYYGLIQLAMHSTVNARDGFDLASISGEFKTAAYTSLATIEMQENNYEGAIKYANKAIDFNRFNLKAIEIKALAYRKLNKVAEAKAILNDIIKMDPLNHFARFEYTQVGDSSIQYFTSLIKNEQPAETYLELACFYNELNGKVESIKLLDLISKHPLANYFQAWLLSNSNPKKSTELLQKANNSSVEFILPFRQEFEPILNWVTHQSTNWRGRYYFALLLESREKYAAALQLLKSCKEEPKEALLYAARAKLLQQYTPNDSIAIQSDLNKSLTLDPANWRYHKAIIDRLIENGNYEQALVTSISYYNEHPANYLMGMLTAKVSLFNKKFNTTDAILKNINIIPFEGATEGRELYREAKVQLAIENFDNKNTVEAIKQLELAMLWPENLGVGAPYAEEVDNRIEFYLLAKFHASLNHTKEANLYKEKLNQYALGTFNDPAGDLLQLSDVGPDMGKLKASVKSIKVETIRNWYLDLLDSKITNLPIAEQKSSMRILNKIKTSIHPF